MSLHDDYQLSKSIASAEKSKSYLENQVDLKTEYDDLNYRLNTTIDRLKNNKPVIKVISPAVNLALKLKKKLKPILICDRFMILKLLIR